MAYRDRDGNPRYRFEYALPAFLLCVAGSYYLAELWFDQGLVGMFVALLIATPLLVNAWKKRIHRGEKMPRQLYNGLLKQPTPAPEDRDDGQRGT